jgi:hypothetical protein
MEPTMPTYTVNFRTDADFATRRFTARSPQHALKKALAFYDERTEDLIFEGYNSGTLVNEIIVRDAGGEEVALWQDDDLRLRLAAGDMLAALDLCVDCLADLARLDDGTPSISALDQARTVIARARNGTAPGTEDTRPQRLSHPKTMSRDHTAGAGAALRYFQCMTGCDYKDSLGDLLRELMHWSDRNNFDFESALFRA